MDSELKQFLEAMEGRLSERLDERINAVEARISTLETRLTAIDERLNAIDARINAVEERLIERIRDTETTLLTEFQKWASQVDLRVRSHTAAIKALDAEMEYLSDRVKKLEDRPTGT